MRRVGLIAAGLIAGLFVVPAAFEATSTDTSAQLDRLFGAHVPFQEFLEALKSAAAARDYAQFERMTAYPLEVRRGGKRVRLIDAAHLRAHAESVFTAAVLKAIARQDYDQLFADQQGAMVGTGEIRFAFTCLRITCASKAMKITAVNLP